jgi:hypothetical protein
LNTQQGADWGCSLHNGGNRYGSARLREAQRVADEIHYYLLQTLRISLQAFRWHQVRGEGAVQLDVVLLGSLSKHVDDVCNLVVDQIRYCDKLYMTGAEAAQQVGSDTDGRVGGTQAQVD